MTPKERLARLKTTINDYGVYRQYTVSDTPFYEDVDGVEKALNELEELKSNKIIIDKEDAERYLNTFEREVLKQLVKQIEDKKKLYSLDRQWEELV